MYQISIKIIGRVQGVNFRRTIARFAKSHQITGFVRNVEDGSVECVAQGSEQSLQALLALCQKGAGLSWVKGMSFEWTEISEKSYNTFSIQKKHHNFFVDQAHSFINLGKELLQNNATVNYPNHIVIIPDGNRRWARSKGWKPWIGHKKAMVLDKMRKLLHVAFTYNISHFTFWGFSTENWNRDPKELEVLFSLYRKNIAEWSEEFAKENIRFFHFGRKDRLAKDIVESMNRLEEDTKNNTRLNFYFCLDYNGRDDLVRAMNKMIKSGVKEVNESTISNFLDTGLNNAPDPDLIIRTSGEQRTSGIMAYQAAYAELYFTKKHFPDFDEIELERAILDYAGRTRRFGGTHIKDIKGLSTQSLVEPGT